MSFRIKSHGFEDETTVGTTPKKNSISVPMLRPTFTTTSIVLPELPSSKVQQVHCGLIECQVLTWI